MKFKYLRHSRSGFTLAELILAISIMMIMGTMTILVYFNMSETSRRLQLSREVSESARQITERIAQEVKQNGIYFFQDKKDTDRVDYQKKFWDSYKDTGETTLIFKNNEGKEWKKLIYRTLNTHTNSVTEWCTNPNEHCGLYLWENGKEAYNLVDAFRTDKKRVTIQDLKFYVTGGDNSANKVTLKMTLALSPQAWVSANLANSTKLEIQTTFSERSYKID